MKPGSVVLCDAGEGPVRMAVLVLLKQRGLAKTLGEAAEMANRRYHWFPAMPYYEEALPLAVALREAGAEVEIKQ